MLDSSLIKFVEPIGPGQIVDRDSLVALPIGYIQVAIENNSRDLVVKIFGIRGIYSDVADENLPANTLIKTYIWQNGEILAGDEWMFGSGTESTNKANGVRQTRRRKGSSKNFCFRKNPNSSANKDSVVDGILQICAYKPTGNLQRKIFLGTVHISLKCLTASRYQSSQESLGGNEEWYKVFPKSAFLPGSPSDIAKTNCYISEQTIEEEVTDEILLENEDTNSTTSANSTTNSYRETNSVVSFSQFGLQRSRTPSIFSKHSTMLRTPVKKTPRENSQKSKRVLMKLLRRHKSVDENKFKRATSTRLPLAISASAPASTSSFLVASPTKTTRMSFESYRSSCSTISSSSDIGYESSLSENISIDDPFRKSSRKSNSFDKTAKKIPTKSQSMPSSPTASANSKPMQIKPARNPSSREGILKRFSTLKITRFSSLTEIIRPEQTVVH